MVEQENGGDSGENKRSPKDLGSEHRLGSSNHPDIPPSYKEDLVTLFEDLDPEGRVILLQLARHLLEKERKLKTPGRG